jgi:acylglycerol lipase
MSHREDHFHTPDGLNLHQQCWIPDGRSTGAVVVIHGFNEHGSRYAELAESLNRQGLMVFTFDLRGYGRSEGARAFVRSFDEYLTDLDVFLAQLRAREPLKRLFLFGHSMGGSIAALYAIARQPSLDGLILSAPAVQVGGKVFPLLRHLAGLVSRLWPSLRVARMGCGFISRDPKVVADFRTDPLVYHGRFPVRTGAEILRAGKLIQDRAAELRLPVLILHGTGDIVTSSEGSRLLLARSSSTDKMLQLYDGLYHDLAHEPEKEYVIADIVRWIKERSGSGD